MGPSRREFLTEAGKIVIALPAGWAFLQAGCGDGYGMDDNGDQPTACSGAGRVTVNASTIAVTSTCVGDHLHVVTVQKSDLTTPPAGGVDLDSSVTNDHQHLIQLSASQLSQIQNGATVTVTSGLTNDHSHNFAIKMTAQNGVDNPGGGYGY